MCLIVGYPTIGQNLLDILTLFYTLSVATNIHLNDILILVGINTTTGGVKGLMTFGYPDL